MATKLNPNIIRDKWNPDPMGRDIVGPDRALRRWSWEDPETTCRSGEIGKAKDVHRRLARIPKLVRAK